MDASSVYVNGKRVILPRGCSVSIHNGRVLINGKEAMDFSDQKGVVEVKLEIVGGGTVSNIDCDGSVTVHEGVKIDGNVMAGSSVRCGDIGGSVNAGSSVNCGSIAGSANAGSSVQCNGTVKGHVADCSNVVHEFNYH